MCVHTHVRITTQPHSGQQSTETICHHLHSAKVQTVKCIFCQYGFYTLESGFCKQRKKKSSIFIFEFLLILKLIFNVFQLNPNPSLRIKVQLTHLPLYKHVLTIIFKEEIILF